MRNQSFAEERTKAVFGVIKNLVRNDDVTRGVILSQRAAGIDADDSFRTECFEGINIGAIRYISGHDVVAESMPGKESDALSFQRTDYYGSGRFAEGCSEIVFLGIGKTRHAI